MSKINNRERCANDLKEILECSAGTDPVLNIISDNTGTEKKYLYNSNTLYLLGQLNTDGNHFMSESCDDGNSNDITDNQRTTGITTDTATDVENNDTSESYDASSSSFTVKDKDILVENLIRVEEIESTRIVNESQTDNEVSLVTCCMTKCSIGFIK